MKISSWNVNSVRARISNILSYIKTSKPDILMIQEIKTEEKNFPFDDFKKHGYRSYVFGQKSYNGVAIISKENINKINLEFIKDSMGQGEYRGGCAVEFHFRVIEDCYVTTVVERTKLAPWGLKGGLEGMPNNAIIEYTDGKRVNVPKATRLFVPKGAKLEVIGGGGGGFGNPSKRNLELIKNDLLNEIISIETVKKHFPQYQNK